MPAAKTTRTSAICSASSRRVAKDYIKRVASGKQTAGRLVRLAVARHLRDLEASRFKKFSYRFDSGGPDRVFRFFSYLCHYKGEFVGRQFKLAPWQAFIVWALFGWVDPEGRRRFRAALISVAKKNGKTAFSAALGLYLFCADREAAAEVFTAATKRDQARLSHGDAVEMARRSPALARRIEFFKDNLTIPKYASRFVPLGSNVDTTDGLNVSAAIVDEIHRHKTRDLWDVLEYGTAARRQPLMLGITTAGAEDGFCYELREHAVKVLEGTLEDPTLFAYIAEPDEGDDDADPKTWIKGNPNLGVSISRRVLAQEYRQARVIPSKLAGFRRYRLNRWILGGADAWMDMERWRVCPALPTASLEGRQCYGGLDLAATQDIAAFVLFFPPEHEQATAHLLPFFFIPEDNIAERARRYRVALEAWVKHGYVTATPGNTIDYAFIRTCIEEQAGRYTIAEIGFDDWNAKQIAVELAEKGLTMVAMQQTVKTFNAPLTKMEDLVAARRLNHGDHPVLRWMASNVVTISDPSGRKKPVKNQGKRHYKIDGIVAALMAMNRWMVHEPEVDTSGLSIAWL